MAPTVAHMEMTGHTAMDTTLYEERSLESSFHVALWSGAQLPKKVLAVPYTRGTGLRPLHRFSWEAGGISFPLDESHFRAWVQALYSAHLHSVLRR